MPLYKTIQSVNSDSNIESAVENKAQIVVWITRHATDDTALLNKEAGKAPQGSVCSPSAGNLKPT